MAGRVDLGVERALPIADLACSGVDALRRRMGYPEHSEEAPVPARGRVPCRAWISALFGGLVVRHRIRPQVLAAGLEILGIAGGERAAGPYGGVRLLGGEQGPRHPGHPTGIDRAHGGIRGGRDRLVLGLYAARPPRLSELPAPRITDSLQKPHVLLVVLDAARPDHLGCYGYSRPTSPHLDRFAGQGIIFENAFAPSAYTMESAPSLFTSTYPSTHGLFSFADRLPPDLPFLPEIFHRHGYRTGIFSTIRNVSPVFGYDRGVDDLFGRAVDPMEGSLLSQYLLHLAERRLPIISGACRGLLNLSQSLFGCRDRVGTEDPRIITEKVVEWIKRDTARPFFAYIHYRGGHHDYTPPAPYDRMFDPSYPGKPVTSYPQGQPSFPPFVQGRPLSESARINMIAQYDGEIRLHDEAMGRLFEALERLNIADRTIIAVHGEEFFEHGGWGHGQSLHEELIHVPLIVRVPESPLQGKRVNSLVSLIDIFPTLCSLCGVPPVQGTRKAAGQDLSPLLRGREMKALRDHVYAELHQGGHEARALRTLSFKAIRVRFGRKVARLLYDIRKDPGEANPSSPESYPNGEALFRQMEDLARAARLSR